MAGILSKGITLSCRGAAGLVYRHVVAFKTNDEGSGKTLVLHSTDPTPITQHTHHKLIGASCYDGTVGQEYYEGSVVATYYELYQGVETIVVADYDDSETYTYAVEPNSINDTVTVVKNDSTEVFVPLTNLQEIPELGNNAPERIDVTVLSDAAKKSISGLIDTAQDLAFKFLYEKTQFETLSKMVGSHEWLVTLPDGTTATFTATPSVKLAGVAPSAALSYTLSLSVESEIVFA
jgi:hypothetical protein